MDISKGTNLVNEILAYITVPKLIICGIVIVVTVALCLGLKFGTKQIKSKLSYENDKTKLSALNISVNLLRIVIIIVAVIVVLQVIGINTGTLTTALAQVLAVLGFAFQDSL